MTMPDQDGLSDRGIAALEYARQGLWVMPLHTPTPAGGCSCRNRECTNPGKHPRTKNGLSDATVDLDRIERWWLMWPESNIGISCGPSGLVVVDVDPRHGGDESWRDLAQSLGADIEETRIGATGGGGAHYVYRTPINEQVSSWASSERYTGPLGPGVDLRASGGYIVAPPSIHASGALYQWEDDREPAVLPYKLLEKIHGPRGSGNQNNLPPLGSTEDILKGVPDGERDWTLYRLASRFRAAGIPIDFAYSYIEEAAANSTPVFPRSEARKRVESAYKRHEPGLGAFEDPTELPKHEAGLQGRVLLGETIRNGIEAPAWVIEDVIPEGKVIVIYGEPGCGKTILDLAWHAQLAASGRPSVFIDEESGLAMMGRRLAFMGVDADRMDEHMHYYPFPGLTVADADALVAYCKDVRPALVTFDSLADMLSISNLDENSATDVTKWMVAVAVRIAQETGAAVVLIDHNSKDVTNVRYSRGSGAKKAKADGSWYVEKTAEFDEQTMGKVTLTRTKNRVGYLRERVFYAAGGRDGKLIVERAETARTSPIVLDPSIARLLEMLDACGEAGASAGDIKRHMDASEWTVRKLIDELRTAGWLNTEGKTHGTKHVITETGRAVIRGIQDASQFRVSELNYEVSESSDAGLFREGGGNTLADASPATSVSPHSEKSKRHGNTETSLTTDVTKWMVAVAVEGKTHGTKHVITETGRAVIRGIQDASQFRVSELNYEVSESSDAGLFREGGGNTLADASPATSVSPHSEKSKRHGNTETSLTESKKTKRDWWSYDTDDEEDE